MDLKAILAAKKAKTERVTPTRKPVAIADQDRPYSIADVPTALPQAATLPLGGQDENEPEVEAKALPDEPGIVIITDENPHPAPEFIAEPNPGQRIETGNKPETKWEQTENKAGTKPETKWKQSGNKPETKSGQVVNKSLIKNQNRKQSGYTTGNKLETKLETKWEQTGNKPETKIAFSELVGLQRNIIIFIYHECKNSRSSVTEALTLEHIATALKCSSDTVKTTIRRLEKKNCLIRVGFKNGRGGWSRYELPNELYHEVLRSETGNKVETKWKQTGNKVGTEPETQPETSAPSSSSSLNLKETTTTESGDEWNFDITPYSRFGFTPGHIKQLASRGAISAAEVEQSLIEFSYDLDNNALPPIKTSKINLLMGILNSGHSYVSEGFKNEQESMIAEMARRAEGKRKRLLEEKFEAWMASLTEEQQKEVEIKLPVHLMALYRAHGVSNSEVRKWVFEFFIQQT